MLVDPQLLEDVDFILKMVKSHPKILKKAPRKIRDNPDIILKAIEINPESYQFASKRLKDNKKIARKVILKNPMMLQYSYIRIKENKKIVLDAIRLNPWVIGFLPLKMREDKEIVLEAVKIRGCTIKYASEELKRDKEIVMTALKRGKKEKFVIAHLPIELRDNEEIVFEAIKNKCYNYFYVSDRLRNNVAFISKLVETVLPFTFVPTKLLHYRQIFLSGVKNSNLTEFQISMFSMKKNRTALFLDYRYHSLPDHKIHNPLLI